MSWGRWPVRVVFLIGQGLLGHAGAAFITGTLNLSTIPREADLPCLTFTGAGAAPAAPAPVSADQAEAQKQFAELEGELKTLTPGSDEYTQLKQGLDLARAALGAAAPRPVSGGKPQSYRPLTVKQAIGNLYVSLAYTVSPKAWQSFQSASALSDPGKARVAATAAVVRGRPLAAVAAYLRVLEKHPQDPDALYNLGALAAFLNAPNEALALLDASEESGGPKSDFYPARAQLLGTRGYALMAVGRSADAVKALQEAVKLAPQFPEAQRNLAAALGNQEQCAAAKKALSLSFRRSVTAQQASTGKPDPEGTLPTDPASPVQPPADTGEAGEQTRLVRDTLDFNRGRVGKWPYFPVNVEPDEEGKLGRMVTDYTAWTKQITGDSLVPLIQKNHTLTLQGAQYIIALARSDPASHARSFFLWDSVRQLYFYPRPSYRAASVLFQKAQGIYYQGETDAQRVLGQKVQTSQDMRSEVEKGCPKAKDTTYCRQKAEYDDMARQCTAIRDWNHLWRGAIPSLENASRAQVAELDRYFSTVLTYISGPPLSSYVQNHYALLRRWQMGTVPLAIAAHLGNLQIMRQPCVYLKTTPPPTPNEALGGYETVEVTPCKPAATYKAKALIFEASMNCEKVGFELSAEVPFLDVGVYVNVEEKFSAGKQTPPSPKDKFLTGQGIVNPERIPRFGETGSSTVSTFGGGVGVKAGAGALGSGVEGKAGFYVTGDGQGNVGDVGAKVESSATLGGEVDVGIGEIGVGVEFEGPGASVSFVPSVDGP